MIGSMTGALTPTARETISISARRAGHVLTGVTVLFLTLDTALKLLGTILAVEATTQLGYPVSVVVPLGIIEALCLVLYLMPRTAVLGAVLWTGYLGGAVATHVRMGHPLFSQVLFPTYVAALVWGSLWLRDARLRVLLPLRAK